MKIIHKMFIAPSTAMLFLILLGVLSVVALQRQDERMRHLNDVTFASFKNVSAQTIALGQIHAEVYGKIAILGSLDDAAVKALTAGVARDADAIAAAFDSRNGDPAVAALAAKVLPVIKRYKAAVADAIDMASVDSNTGIASMQSAGAEYQTLRTLLAASIKDTEEATRQAIAAGERGNRMMVWVTAGTLVLTMLLLGLISVRVARSVTGPLNQAIQIAQTVADGQLDNDFTHEAKDEIGDLLDALKAMNDSLAKVVGEVRAGTDEIATASGEIAAGNMNLSGRTEAQASSLEQTSASMEDLTTTVRQNAEHSREASVLAGAASETAVRGGAVVAQVITTMSSINASSRKIADIIGVIDSIAFQTNILALNAAVEAARAGEQGRGFAVVASEVRGLAQRSANAAKEISDLISASVQQVDAGSKLVDQAGSTMFDIVDSIKRVNNIMAEITAASVEQSAGIAQVNQAIAQMDDATQQNAALVEQAAAATQNMQSRAERLVQVVSVFRGGQTGGAARPLRLS